METMLFKQNKLTGDWLCYIPGTSQAYYVPTKKHAAKFCANVNNAFNSGELKIIEGEVVKTN
jgi:hypothetical protein